MPSSCIPGYKCSKHNGKCIETSCENDRDCPPLHKCLGSTKGENYCSFTECKHDDDCGEGNKINKSVIKTNFY